MKKEIFCTIITANFSHYALALYDSLVKQDQDAALAIFISNGKLSEWHAREFSNRPDIKLYYFEDLRDFGLTKALQEKYAQDYHDAFRWGMKPVFISFLLQKFGKVIYLDSDLYFFNDYKFLFKELEYSRVLLTPHWRSVNPEVEYSNFVHNFRDGIYNAGFIGAARGAEEAMNWWAKMVLFKCEVDRRNGYYVDQRYLDLLPIHFEGVKHLIHKGCNVANWNKVVCKRTKNDNGEIVINDKYPIVFIHFTNTMLYGIFFEHDKLLLPYLKIYRDNLLKYSNVDIIEDFHKRGKFKKSRSEEDFLKPMPVKKDFKIKEQSKSLLKKLYRKLI